MSYSRAVQHLAMHQSGYEMNSPLLFGLFNQFNEESYYEILDITPANRLFMQYIEHLHCKVYLPGCDEQLMNINMEKLDTENKIYRALSNNLMLYKKHKAKLNLILLWDLPNYLEPKLLSALIQFLLIHCRDDVMLHCYIHTRENMPMLPAQYRFSEDQKVRVDQRAEQTCQSPMFYQESLQKLVLPFLVEKGMLLSNGLQEYILRRR